MSTAKIKKMLLGALTIIGGLFVATAAIRANETSKATGTSFTSALGNEAKILTKTKIA